MKRTDFAGALYRYFRDYLVNDRGCSARKGFWHWP